MCLHSSSSLSFFIDRFREWNRIDFFPGVHSPLVSSLSLPPSQQLHPWTRVYLVLYCCWSPPARLIYASSSSISNQKNGRRRHPRTFDGDCPSLRRYLDQPCHQDLFGSSDLCPPPVLGISSDGLVRVARVRATKPFAQGWTLDNARVLCALGHERQPVAHETAANPRPLLVHLVSQLGGVFRAFVESSLTEASFLGGMLVLGAGLLGKSSCD